MGRNIIIIDDRWLLMVCICPNSPFWCVLMVIPCWVINSQESTARVWLYHRLLISSHRHILRMIIQSFCHVTSSSCNDTRQSTPRRLPLAKDGSNSRWHSEKYELALLFCPARLEVLFFFDIPAKRRPIQWPSAIVRNDASNPYRPACNGETPIAPPVNREIPRQIMSVDRYEQPTVNSNTYKKWFGISL